MKKLRMRRIPVQSLASGDRLTIPVYDIPGSRAGAPTAYLQSAVHGSEVQGSLVLALLLEYLAKHPPLGNIRIVPNANPIGLNNKRGEYTDGRFDPVTGDNFNRQYYLPSKGLDWETFLGKIRGRTSKESAALYRKELKRALSLRQKEGKAGLAAQRLAWKLQELSLDFDHCLDLHCANRSARHCYVPQAVAESAKFFTNIPFLLEMPNDRFGGAFDEVCFAPWAEFQKRTGHPHPVQSFTLELGNHEDAQYAAAEKDLTGILNYLRHRGVLAGGAKPGRPVRTPLERYTVLVAEAGGIVDFPAPLGKRIAKGTVVARVLRFGKAPEFTELKAPFAGYITLIHSSAVAHEGAELVKMVPAEAPLPSRR